MKLGEITDADKAMNPLHCGSNPADTQIDPDLSLFLRSNSPSSI